MTTRKLKPNDPIGLLVRVYRKDVYLPTRTTSVPFYRRKDLRVWVHGAPSDVSAGLIVVPVPEDVKAEYSAELASKRKSRSLRAATEARHKNASDGLCPCGAARDREDRKKCEACRALDSERHARMRERRLASRTCTRCKSPAADGLTVCAAHHASNLEQRKKRRAR